MAFFAIVISHFLFTHVNCLLLRQMGVEIQILALGRGMASGNHVLTDYEAVVAFYIPVVACIALAGGAGAWQRSRNFSGVGKAFLTWIKLTAATQATASVIFMLIRQPRVGGFTANSIFLETLAWIVAGVLLLWWLALTISILPADFLRLATSSLETRREHINEFCYKNVALPYVIGAGLFFLAILPGTWRVDGTLVMHGLGAAIIYWRVTQTFHQNRTLRDHTFTMRWQYLAGALTLAALIRLHMYYGF